MSDVTQLPVLHLFTFEAKVNSPPPQVIAAPNGMRVVVAVGEGTIRGARINGTVAPGSGGDFAVFRPDGSLRLDVRLVIVTDDEHRIYMTYNGVGLPDGEGNLALKTAPTFEAPDGPYAWMNNVQAIGVGTSSPATGDLRYEVYELV
ncbi:MAG TPA: DUF3237 domain-containing protein [Acidimicrobiales bacterium]|nr:DUF3237 domain-containing protein [Acidimicrobiales bacterium]